jgi:hypothetical protein
VVRSSVGNLAALVRLYRRKGEGEVRLTSSASALRGFPDGPSILVTQRAQETGAPDGL